MMRTQLPRWQVCAAEPGFKARRPAPGPTSWLRAASSRLRPGLSAQGAQRAPGRDPLVPPAPRIRARHPRRGLLGPSVCKPFSPHSHDTPGSSPPNRGPNLKRSLSGFSLTPSSVVRNPLRLSRRGGRCSPCFPRSPRLFCEPLFLMPIAPWSFNPLQGTHRYSGHVTSVGSSRKRQESS
ncbi:hypothetical protein CB1_001428016 [Camelus ferus]|nr:hypothetical protein CB1_001428016 [Camelus ferus]